MSARSRRGGYEPSWTEVTIGALLSVLIGAVLGVAYLVVKPVATVKELPKEEDRDSTTIYYIEGTRDAAKGKLAAAKRKTFAGGGSVIVDENELNTLVGPAVPAAAPKPAPGAKPAPPAAAPTGVNYAVGVPNFRIRESELQIGLPLKLDLFGVELSAIVQSRGTFVKVGDSFSFEPKTMLVGSCPVDRLPMARDFILKKVLQAQPVPEDIAKVWGKLSEAAVIGSAVILTMP